jgi:hypothetical protein
MSDFAIAIGVLCLSGVAVLAVIRRLIPPAELRDPQPRTRGPFGPMPDDLGRLERGVSVGVSQASTVHLSLRPVLREIATERLRRRGIELDRDPKAAHDLLGDDAWDLVRADRPPPKRPLDAGLGLDRLQAVVDRLEEI